MPAKRETPKMPKTAQASKEMFAELVPEHPRVATRAMFGGIAAFANGNMFSGFHGDDLFLRLPEDAREELSAAGGSPFEPMPGRPMGEYVVVPRAWRDEPARLEEWFQRSMDWALTLPPKQPKKRKG
ncbi:MAG TPA: TfoX/Sxy family protein [Actinomycetota bacterium]|nr:TfoX/Sxy family protein [Actinomycetota bacterium]